VFAAGHPTPCFPDFAGQYPGEQEVHHAEDLKDRETDGRDHRAEDQPVWIFGGGSGWIGENSEREIKGGVQVWCAENPRNGAGITDKCSGCEERKVSAGEDQYPRR
jgi:hypothetical protein